MLSVEYDAPEFSLKNQDGAEVSLRDFRGKWIVLYFYPKDNTLSCTAEARNFNVNLQEFKNLNAVVLGVSPDSPTTHKNFVRKYSIFLTLLCDEDKSVSKKYDVWKQKNIINGRRHMGVERSTFIINTHGKVVTIWRKVNVKGHAEEVKEFLEVLQR